MARGKEPGGLEELQKIEPKAREVRRKYLDGLKAAKDDRERCPLQLMADAGLQ